MKKRVWITITSIVVTLLLVGLVACYLIYDKAGAYLMEETLVSQMTQEIIAQTGINLGEAGRVLTEEEIESFKSVLNTEGKDKQESTPKDTGNKTQSETNQKVETIKGPTKENKPVTTDDLKIAVQKQAKEIANSIPNKDKSAMLNLVISNLSSSDINYLMSLVLDGVSSSDLTEAKRIAKERFSQDELERVKGYYDAYEYLLP